jgi:hypothetical protein
MRKRKLLSDKPPVSFENFARAGACRRGARVTRRADLHISVEICGALRYVNDKVANWRS